MPGKSNIDRKVGVILKGFFVEAEGSQRLPVDFSGGDSYPIEMKVSFCEKTINGKRFAGDIREVHTKPTPSLAKGSDEKTS
ncbi:hypothetical protein EXS56_01285 [Candidatus Kaiserbacteria bacterium]|nr:hypothetical protein [Candidatus Kaiserbacteria bacterium]